MADVFISYSKKDRLLALKASALLESHGYSTWWDSDLRIGDAFRNNIDTELTVAAAVIVLWTKNSVESDWVRAEAGRGRQHEKLIPLRTSDLSHDDIPLPFGEMHTEFVDDETAILEAIDGLIKKSKKQPAFWKKLRYDVVTWFGIVGTAITLTSNLRGVIQLANWIRFGVEQWVGFVTFIWSSVLFFLPQVSQADAILLTLSAFTVRTFFAFAPEKYPTIFAKELWVKGLNLSISDRITMAIPVVFCLLAFIIGYLDLLGAFNESVLLGHGQIQASEGRDVGFLTKFLIDHLLLDMPGNLQVAQISIMAFAAPFLLVEAFSLILRRQIDFKKSSRRAAVVMFILILALSANFFSVWLEKQPWTTKYIG